MAALWRMFVVFGDDYNDLVMFDDAWFSIAMGNACDALKKKADYVTERNVDDGIYKACLKFGVDFVGLRFIKQH